MRRFSYSLVIALILSFVFTSQVLAMGMNSASSYRPVSEFQRIHSNSIHQPFTDINYDDSSDIPDGLTLTQGSPFISVTEANKGDSLAIKIRATNDSPFEINYTLKLYINDQAAGSKQISLAPGNSEDIVFPIVADINGTNNIRIGKLTGIFTVKSGAIWDILPPYILAFIGIVLGVIIMFIVLIVTKPKPKKKQDSKLGMDKKQGKSKEQTGKQAKGGMDSQIPMPSPSQRTGAIGGTDTMTYPTPAFNQQTSQFDTPSGMPQFSQQQQNQPGMQPPMQPGMQQGMQSPQRQQYPGQQPQGMSGQFSASQQPGATPMMPQQSQDTGMQMPPFGQQQGPGMPFSTQQQSGFPQHMQTQPFSSPGQFQQPFSNSGVSPIMQPQTAPGMPQAFQPAMQQPASGRYQSMGMPRFTISNFTINPNAVKVSEPVNISAIVSNNGMQSGKYSVVLRVSGVVENISDITLQPGGNQTVSFTVVKDSAGDYYADVDGIGGFFTVIPLTPPAFSVSNFSIKPERVSQGQPVFVNATVTNTGELQGTHTLILRVKGLAENQQQIELAPGKTQNVEFQIIKDAPGFYPVALENWTGKFVVEMDWNG